MSRKPIYILLAMLVLISMACSLTVNLPVDNITTGPAQTEEISVKEPDASSVDLNLSFGAGELNITPGAQGALVQGTATYNVEQFKPQVKVEGQKITLSTGDLEIKGFPKFSNDIKNEWNLKLSAMPMSLTVSAGAYQGNYELGGLSLKALEISDGAAESTLKFSEPNKVDMESLRYTTGASNVKLAGLGNANFTSMIFRSGAGDYSLDFSGAWKREAVITIESGISHVVIIMPKNVSARVYFKGGLANVDVKSGWKKSGDQYTLEGGSGPALTINIDMGAGSLELQTE